MFRSFFLTAALVCCCALVPASASASGVDVFLVHADLSTPTALVSQLEAQPDVASVTVHDEGASSTPSLTTLESYDLVVAMSNFGWADATALGDNLADYVDGGGAVASLNFSSSGSPWGIAGRWETEQYSPYSQSYDYDFTTTATLGTHDSSHPVMQGVSALSSSKRQGLSLTPGTTVIAEWNDGKTLAAVKPGVLGVNAYLGEYHGASWSGDFARLIVNAVSLDSAPVDTDGDGVPDETDAFPNDASETTDSDGDGVGDNADNCPTNANTNQVDRDNDGTGAACDTQELPLTKDDCKKGRWSSYDGTATFSDQDDCVGYVASGGKNPPSGR